MNSFTKTMLIIYIVMIGCKKEDYFPNVSVNESIFITGQPYNWPNGHIYDFILISGGIGGIIIVQGHNDTFIAYDQACTYENYNDNINTDCIINYDTLSTNTHIFSCTECCKSKFSIIDGSVSQGPATMGLKIYNTYFDGSHLHITN